GGGPGPGRPRGALPDHFGRLGGGAAHPGGRATDEHTTPGVCAYPWIDPYPEAVRQSIVAHPSHARQCRPLEHHRHAERAGNGPNRRGKRRDPAIRRVAAALTPPSSRRAITACHAHHAAHANGLSSQAREGTFADSVSGIGPDLRAPRRGAALREWSTEERGMVRPASASAASP